MNIEEFTSYCNAKQGVTEHLPFDDDTLVFKTGGKMFALTSISGWEKSVPTVNLKCVPDQSEELRAAYSGIQPGYHMNKVHWNTVFINSDVPDKLVKQLIDQSYQLVFNALPQKVKQQI